MNAGRDAEGALREAVCEVGRRLYARKFVAATDGNVSVRLDGGRYLCTPSGVSKGFMRPEELIIADAAGEKVSGDGKVTSEFYTHLAAYEQRPDIGAVVHAHTPVATALTLAGVSLMRPVLPEVVMGLRGVPTTAYATPGSREGAEVIRPYIREYDAVLLDRHGAVAVGRDVFEAYFRIEKVEHAAETLWYALCLGRVPELDAAQVAQLGQSRAAYGEGA